MAKGEDYWNLEDHPNFPTKIKFTKYIEINLWFFWNDGTHWEVTNTFITNRTLKKNLGTPMSSQGNILTNMFQSFGGKSETITPQTILTRWIIPAAVNHTDIKIDTNWARRMELEVFKMLRYCKISGTVIKRRALKNRRPVCIKIYVIENALKVSV